MSRTYRRTWARNKKFHEPSPRTYTFRGYTYPEEYSEAVRQGRDGSHHKEKLGSVVEDQLNTWDTAPRGHDTAYERRSIRRYYKNKLMKETAFEE